MQNFNDIKKRLGMSTTMPATALGSSAPQVMMGSAAQQHDHAHHDEDEDCDNTSPKGGCGCC